MADLLLAWMKRKGLPITREKYLALAYGSSLPHPWTPEHEAELPEELRSEVADAGEWREELHPRGQPENKGQFGPGGGGAAESKPAAPAKPKPATPQRVKRAAEKLEREYAAARETIRARAKELRALGPQAMRARGKERGGQQPTRLERVEPEQKELFPGQFPSIPEPKEKVKPEDFGKAKVELNRDLIGESAKAKKFVETWDKHVGLAPEEFKNEFLGGINATMRLEYFHDESEGRVYSDSIEISGELMSEQGRHIGSYRREIDFKNNEAESTFFSITGSQTGRNLGKQMLAANVALYQKLGLDRVKVHANIDVGGYAWAKYGYVPNEESWDELRNTLRSKTGGGGGGYTPESWDEMTDIQQVAAREAWKENTYDEFLQSEEESWRESGEALDQAKQQLAEKFKPADAWAQNALDKWRAESEAKITLSNEDILKAISIDYEAGYGGKYDPEVTLALSSLWDEQRTEIEDAITDAFNERAERDQGDIEPPDLSESVIDLQNQIWDDMSNRQKFEAAESAGIEPAESEKEGEISVSEEVEELLDSDDPKSIWEISDMPGGKELLLGSDWSGAIDFSDQDAMTRFNAYVGRKPRAEAAS
jgi:hypothetical protein